MKIQCGGSKKESISIGYPGQPITAEELEKLSQIYGFAVKKGGDSLSITVDTYGMEDLDVVRLRSWFTGVLHCMRYLGREVDNE